MSEELALDVQAAPITPSDAHNRAIEDFSQFSQHSREAARIIFAANGGGAISILSSLSTLMASSRPRASAILLVYYRYAAASFMAGAFLAIFGMFLLLWAKRKFGTVWQDAAETPKSRHARLAEARPAVWIENAGLILLALATFAFLTGAYLAARALAI